MAVEETQESHLFGGAFSACLPPGSLDISEMRQVPDNQEVFVHPDTDQSVIVELLEYQAEVPDENAARYHFEDIASSSDSSEILSEEQFPLAPLAFEGCSSAWKLTCRQDIAKFNEEPSKFQCCAKYRGPLGTFSTAVDSGTFLRFCVQLAAPESWCVWLKDSSVFTCQKSSAAVILDPFVMQTIK